MIQESDENILSKSDLLMLRDQKLREFLDKWFDNTSSGTKPIGLKLRIEERVWYRGYKNYETASSKQASINIPLNYNDFGIDKCIDWIVKQVYDQIQDVPWDKDIFDFEYVEVAITGISDFASLYPNVIQDSNKLHYFTSDRFLLRKQ